MNQTLASLLHRLLWYGTLVFLIAISFWYYPRWKQPHTEATLSWDASGYYLYLPAIFIYKDVKKVHFLDEVTQKYTPSPGMDQAYALPNGNKCMKYSSGNALLFLPFFVAGHTIASTIGGGPADGFSRPYQFCMQFGALCYALLGLWFLRRFLLKFVVVKYQPLSPWVVDITLLALVVATNYLDYAAINGCMSHSPLFMMYALLLNATAEWHITRHRKWLYLIGGVCGWMTLIRPTEIISILIPLLWGVNPMLWRTVLAKWHLMRTHWKDVCLALCIGACFVSIQLVYWKYVTGHWVEYSYGDQGFSWKNPHWKEFFVGGVSGWFLYTPVMAIACVGLYLLWKWSWPHAWALILFALLFLYIAAAWDAWQYGGSLSQRAAVQAYPVFAIGLAVVIQWLWNRGVPGQSIVVLWCVVFAWYNLWLTHHAHRGGLVRVGQMSYAYLFHAMGRMTIAPDDLLLLESKEHRTGTCPDPHIIYRNAFEDEHPHEVPMINGGGTLRLIPNDPRVPEYIVPVHRMKNTWVRMSALYRCATPEPEAWKMFQCILRFRYAGKIIKENMIRVDRVLKPGEVRRVAIDSRVPDIVCDELVITFYNPGGVTPMCIDDMEVELCEER